MNANARHLMLARTSVSLFICMLVPAGAKVLTQSSQLQVHHILATDVSEVSELAAACQGLDKQLAEDMLQLNKQ